MNLIILIILASLIEGSQIKRAKGWGKGAKFIGKNRSQTSSLKPVLRLAEIDDVESELSPLTTESPDSSNSETTTILSSPQSYQSSPLTAEDRESGLNEDVFFPSSISKENKTPNKEITKAVKLMEKTLKPKKFAVDWNEKIPQAPLVPSTIHFPPSQPLCIPPRLMRPQRSKSCCPLSTPKHSSNTMSNNEQLTMWIEIYPLLHPVGPIFSLVLRQINSVPVVLGFLTSGLETVGTEQMQICPFDDLVIPILQHAYPGCQILTAQE